MISIHLKLNYESAYVTVLRLRKAATIHNKMIHHQEYDCKINIWKNHLAKTHDIVTYRDGSELKSGATGLAFLAQKQFKKIKTCSVPLESAIAFSEPSY